MRNSLAIAFAASLLFTGAAEAQKLVGDVSIKSLPTPVLLETEGMFIDRFAKVGDDFFVAGQPTERALREMKAQGLTTVINLRMPEEMERVGFDEAKLVASLGMKYIYIPMRGGRGAMSYSPATLARFTEAMRTAEGKVATPLHRRMAGESHLGGLPHSTGREGRNCTGTCARDQSHGRPPHG